MQSTAAPTTAASPATGFSTATMPRWSAWCSQPAAGPAGLSTAQPGAPVVRTSQHRLT